jgi:DNA-binding NtrC family response regulator
MKFKSGKECIDALKHNPDIITLDYRLPDMEGEKVLKEIKSFKQDIEVVIISEQESIETAVSLLRLGAYDYLVKTKDIRDRLLNVVQNIRNQRGLQKKVETLQKEVEVKYDFKRSLIGNSEPMKKVFELIDKAIKTNIVVMITGETGTGKELAAKAIHYNSTRKKGNFVPVNMAAVPRELVESELFGHEKGAFTGAQARRIGKFEEADGGTLFLDEIGEMDLSVQAKLLRALQEKEITRVGSNKPVKTDCRIIVASNRNLQEEVKQGNFRDDLYFRLFGLTINMPPLRERENDRLMLARFFLENFCKENDLLLKVMSRSAQKMLLDYSFPGNVRELRSIIELSAVMSNEVEILPEDITFGSSDDSFSEDTNRELTLREHTHKIVKSYLNKYDNNVKLVAKKLDVGFSTIYRMLKEMEEHPHEKQLN